MRISPIRPHSKMDGWYSRHVKRICYLPMLWIRWVEDLFHSSSMSNNGYLQIVGGEWSSFLSAHGAGFFISTYGSYDAPVDASIQQLGYNASLAGSIDIHVFVATEATTWGGIKHLFSIGN